MTRRLSNADEARYDRAADRVEAMDGLPADSAVVDGSATQAGRDLMNELFGSPAAVERAMGRPSVDGSMTAGHSPVVRAAAVTGLVLSGLVVIVLVVPLSRMLLTLISFAL